MQRGSSGEAMMEGSKSPAADHGPSHSQDEDPSDTVDGRC
jgi:hypothetical protein